MDRRLRCENGNPLQYSCLENPMGREAWWATVHGVTKSRTQLSDWAYEIWNIINQEKDCTAQPSATIQACKA